MATFPSGSPVRHERAQTPAEEWANAVSHGAGVLGAIVALPVLIVSAVRQGDAADIVGASIFGATVLVVYLTSTLYHAFRGPRIKRFFRLLDHSAIFLLIAGTYTPFCLGVLRGGWGWTLFGIVWGLALGGITLKAIGGFRFSRLSMVLYLSMGWLIIIAVKPLWDLMPLPGLLWLAAGGLAYTAGTLFYRADRIPFTHFAWHLFVLTGTVCHFVAVWRFAY